MEDYLNTIKDEDLRTLKKEIKTNIIRDRCTFFLQSLQGKTIWITALNIDIVNSSEKVKALSSEAVVEYYQEFIGNTSDLIEDHGGYVLKNVGDCVIGLFPCSKYFVENHDKAVSCGLAMCDMLKEKLNPYFMERKLPSIACRISADFGVANVVRVRSNGVYPAVDLFGGAMNSAAKISHYAKPNQMVIGENLLQQLIDVMDFQFKSINGFSQLGNHKYSVYLVERRSS